MLPEGVWKVVDELKGTLGDSDSEVIRNIVIAHLSDKGILSPSHRLEGIPADSDAELRLQQRRLTALVDLLEAKGLILQSEWLSRLKEELQKAGSQK